MSKSLYRARPVRPTVCAGHVLYAEAVTSRREAGGMDARAARTRRNEAYTYIRVVGTRRYTYVYIDVYVGGKILHKYAYIYIYIYEYIHMLCIYICTYIGRDNLHIYIYI